MGWRRKPNMTRVTIHNGREECGTCIGEHRPSAYSLKCTHVMRASSSVFKLRTSCLMGASHSGIKSMGLACDMALMLSMQNVDLTCNAGLTLFNTTLTMLGEMVAYFGFDAGLTSLGNNTNCMNFTRRVDADPWGFMSRRCGIGLGRLALKG